MKEREGMSNEPSSFLDPLSLVVIVLTLVLFVIALFVKGFSHELLQECGVFLVSVKLIMMSHKNGASAQRAEERLAKIQNLLQSKPDGAWYAHLFANSAASNLSSGVLHFLVCLIFEERMAWPRKPKSVTP
jgi:hypothetical protein